MPFRRRSPIARFGDLCGFFLDCPVVARAPVGSRCRQPSWWGACDLDRDLLADLLVVPVETLATYAGDLLYVRVVDSFRAGDPAGPYLGASPLAFCHDVVRRFLKY